MARKPDICYINQYVSGSTACKLEQQPLSRKTAKLPKLRQEQKVTFTIEPAAVLSIATAVVLLIVVLTGYFQFAKAEEDLRMMENYVSKLQQENQQLEEEYRQGYDLDEIREQALAMGMVPVSEVDRITVSVSVPTEEEPASTWDEIILFLTGLFA